jgi:PhnB protein
METMRELARQRRKPAKRLEATHLVKKETTMDMTPYLTFDGRCREAFEFYARTLGGTIEMMLTHTDSPVADQVPKAWGPMIMHARLRAGNAVLMGSDAPPEHRQPPQGFSVSLAIEKPADADRVFAALADGGSVTMPIQQTFWAERFGMCVDRFGIPWMVNCEGALSAR